MNDETCPSPTYYSWLQNPWQTELPPASALGNVLSLAHDEAPAHIHLLHRKGWRETSGSGDLFAYWNSPGLRR